MKKRKNKTILILLIIGLASFTLAGFFYYYNNKSLDLHPLNQYEDLDELTKQASNSSYVLLGETSHGTADYYIWRKKITQRLISEHDFNFILVEGDWDSIYKLNLYVKHLSHPKGGAYEIMENFERWPTWMWANYEFLEFIEWLRKYNLNLEEDRRVGVYGMDVYGLSNSMDEVIDYFRDNDKSIADEIKDLYTCLLDYQDDYSSYIQDLYEEKNNCQKPVLEALEIVKENSQDTYEYFNIAQNAKVVVYGEMHYRANLYPDSRAWNARVEGMKDRFNNLLNYYGENSKAIVWAHNTHIGDARATDMKEKGSINIGQLLREKYDDDKVFAVGFSTFSGTVTASHAWQEAERAFMIPNAREGSLEYILNKKDLDNFYILLNDNLPKFLSEKIGHRAKGVVYNPMYDKHSYVETIVSDRYDALIFISNTEHLNSIK